MGMLQIWEQLRNYEVEFFIPYRQPIDIANDAMAQRTIDGGFDYLLRMDDDIWDVPFDAVEKLIKADKEFISCVMYASGFPYHRCAFIKKDKEKSLVDTGEQQKGGLKEAGGVGIVPVDMSAFPFALIKVDVFKKIKPPWFTHTLTVPLDNYFCQKMLDNKIQPYVDMDLQVTHREITYWNRCHRFISDAENMISTGKMDDKHQLWNHYLGIKEKFAERYSKKILVSN
jgi:hypothetical protein